MVVGKERFVATNTNNPLFSVQPAVSAAGTLTYTPAGPTGVATVSVNIHDNGGTANGGSDTSAVQTFTITITADTAGPTGGSVDASGLVGTGSRYAASTTLILVLAKGIDPSGVAATGNLLNRATATLTSGGTANGTCGTYGSYTLVSGGTDPVSPKSDTVSDQACYSYQYVVLDTLGNPTTYTSPDIKVDLTPPAAPSLAHSAFTNTYWSSGSIVYYRSAASTGSFTTTATATDTKSGIASYTFPALGTNWTSTPGAVGVNTYSWSGTPQVPGAKSITATNNATGVSGGTSFTPTADDTPPSAGSVSYTDGSTTGTTVSVSFTTGTDTGSGVGTRLLQRASATATGVNCGTYGTFSTVTNGTNPTSPVTDIIATGNCYKYQYVVPDNVGNQYIATSGNVAHAVFGAYWAFDQGSGTTATDSTGNGNTATLQTGATWTAGKVGANALNLDGTTGFASTAAPVIDTSQSYSVAAWVRPTSTSGHKTIVALDGNSVSPFYLQIVNGYYVFALRDVDNAPTSVQTVTTGVAATVNVWTHLVAVHDNAANTVSLYVNGVLQSTVAFNSPWKANGATTVGRAKWNGASTDFFSGAIDEVRLYDRVLTAAEITSLAA
jgi:Concanavalin A-like lectin/glucanases superfamily